MEREKLLTTKQVADRLNMHPKTLYRSLRENTIALNYIQLSPRRFGFRPADVQRYLDEREVIRTGDSPKKPRKQFRPKHTDSGKNRKFSFFKDAEAQLLWADVRKPLTALDRTEP
jgi:hypothetical protein